MRRHAGLIIVVVLVLLTDHWFGAIGVTRLVGLLVLCFCAFAGFAREFPVSVGKKEIARLRGWKKAYALVPLGAIGLALVLHAPAITCATPKYKHLCS